MPVAKRLHAAQQQWGGEHFLPMIGAMARAGVPRETMGRWLGERLGGPVPTMTVQHWVERARALPEPLSAQDAQDVLRTIRGWLFEEEEEEENVQNV